jgi:hypothetical protein
MNVDKHILIIHKNFYKYYYFLVKKKNDFQYNLYVFLKIYEHPKIFLI